MKHPLSLSESPAVAERPRFIWLPLVAADARTSVTFSLSPSQAHDAPEGRKLFNRLGQQQWNTSLLMDRAYAGNETRQLALALGFTPVVPPLSARVRPRGSTPGRCTRGATKSRGCSGG